MKKYAMILIMALVLTFAAACGRNGDDDNGGAGRVQANGDAVWEVTPGVPLMWHVTSPGGQTMYLFGSVHVGMEDMYPLPDFVMDAFGRTDYLAVEFDLVAFEGDIDAAMAAAMEMFYFDGRTLTDSIGDELFGQVRDAMTELNASADMMMMLNMIRPWAVPQLILELVLEQTSIYAQFGVDRYFIDLANERGMGILEVESAASQFEMLSSFSMPLVIQQIRDSLELEYAVDSAYFMVDVWKNGDYEMLLTLLEESMANFPPNLRREYNQAMFIDRDIHMAEMARQYMADGKKVFFVMGLLHFAGEDSIVYLLREAGYTVELVRP